ncbi:RHS repeat-associated core domain-containing protein, partial [Neisseria sicca]
TAYGYDAAGQLVQQTEYGQSNHEGRLKERPETWHIHHFKRNILGQLIEKQSRKVSGRNGQSKDEGISRTRFEYDPVTGNLTKARNQHSSVELAYDELDRLIGETTVHNGQSATVGYQYDPLGNRIRTILPDGRHIDYLYYGSGHLHQISLDGEVVSDIERDKLHREIQRTQGSISSLYDYDPMGRLKSQRTVRSGTQTLRGKQNPLAGGAVNRRYAYDKAGNLIQSADQRSGVLHYVYDKIGRIQEARNSQTGRSETFAFDPAHNILDIPTSTPSPVGEGKATAPISDDPQTQGRLKSPAHPNPVSGNRLKEYNGIEYTYDALGNLIYRQLPGGENQYYQYDLENQLVRAEIKKPAGNTEIWTYAYDPFGRRLSKERQDKLAWTSTDPKRTHFVWDGTRLLQEYTYKGCYTYIYTDQDSYEPLAQVFRNNQDETQYLAYFHTDQVGIPKEMTDIHGNLLWYGEYTAWGRLKKDGRVYKDAHQPFRLQNQYFDEETGLHYNLMRYYEPEAGRFVNQDPIGLLGGENLYWFAPNTQSWVDWLGLHSDPDLLNRITRVMGAMSEGDRSRTTYALARVTTSSGRSEIWMASAGQRGWVSPTLREAAGADEVIHNTYGNNKNHINDAERKLMREARKRGAKIESIAATRPMCGRCQKGARKMGILRRVITSLKR